MDSSKFYKAIVYQQCISKVSCRILREKIKKVLMRSFLIKNGTIKVFIETFEGKLHYVLVNLAQISTNNPL
jgi:hypothetical protein